MTYKNFRATASGKFIRWYGENSFYIGAKIQKALQLFSESPHSENGGVLWNYDILYVTEFACVSFCGFV